MARPKNEKVTPETVAQLESIAKAALHVLHSRQHIEEDAREELRAAVENRQDAEKNYTLAVRRWKLAEAKLPPPAAPEFHVLTDNALENIASEVLAEESLTEPLTEPLSVVWANGEPVEV